MWLMCVVYGNVVLLKIQNVTPTFCSSAQQEIHGYVIILKSYNLLYSKN